MIVSLAELNTLLHYNDSMTVALCVSENFWKKEKYHSDRSPIHLKLFYKDGNFQLVLESSSRRLLNKVKLKKKIVKED